MQVCNFKKNNRKCCSRDKSKINYSLNFQQLKIYCITPKNVIYIYYRKVKK